MQTFGIVRSCMWLGLAVACLSLAVPALAQQAPEAEAPMDWDLDRDDNALAAVLAFEPGPTFIVRCAGRRLDVLITGLPAVPEDAVSRIVDMKWGDEPGTTPPWSAVASTVAVSQAPDWLARTLRHGGSLRMTARAALDAPGSQYRLDIPPSPNAINEVLEACRMPLEDPRDVDMASAFDRSLLEGLEWRQRPAPKFPQQAMIAGAREGMARLSCCVQPTGRVTDCRIESESTPGIGFGPSAMASMRGARLKPGSPSPHPDGSPPLVSFTIRFRLA
ncbi:MAG: TonB family protein [Brevundimonas sp.]|nr:MAG: TonB family protein [Brevundimonas sp.]